MAEMPLSNAIININININHITPIFILLAKPRWKPTYRRRGFT